MLEAVVLATRAYAGHAAEMGQAVQEILGAAQASKQQLGAAAADARECCQGVADAAAARWSRLLTGRARASGEAGAAGIRWAGSWGFQQQLDCPHARLPACLPACVHLLRASNRLHVPMWSTI